MVEECPRAAAGGLNLNWKAPLHLSALAITFYLFGDFPDGRVRRTGIQLQQDKQLFKYFFKRS